MIKTFKYINFEIFANYFIIYIQVFILIKITSGSLVKNFQLIISNLQYI